MRLQRLRLSILALTQRGHVRARIYYSFHSRSFPNTLFLLVIFPISESGIKDA